MNPESEEEPANCPAEVFADRECTRHVEKEDKVGWMKWGRKVSVAIKLDGLWVPYDLHHHVARFRGAALRCAA